MFQVFFTLFHKLSNYQVKIVLQIVFKATNRKQTSELKEKVFGNGVKSDMFFFFIICSENESVTRAAVHRNVPSLP